MPPIRRILAALAGVLAFLVYIWVAAVHGLGGVKRRKRLRRAARPRP